MEEYPKRFRLTPAEPRTNESVPSGLSTCPSFDGMNELPGLPLAKRSMNPTIGLVYLIWSHIWIQDRKSSERQKQNQIIGSEITDSDT